MIEKINEEIFEYDINGLKVYIYKNEKVNQSKVSFVVKYGSYYNKFFSYDEKKYIEVPNGIAHFLEHKMFEYKIDPFKFFEEHGAFCNAYTTYDHTNYYFKTSVNFFENLNFLLDFVQEPNFTDENVLKEKGIIKQEILMIEDDLIYSVFNSLVFNSFHNDYSKYKIIGSIEDIERTTKEDLYKCYNSFYIPTNMFLVITGNIDIEKTIKVIEENQNNKKFENNEIKLKKVVEPLEVSKSFERINKGVKNPILGFSIKLKNESLVNEVYTDIILDYLFGADSEFVEQLKKESIIDKPFSVSKTRFKDYTLYYEVIVTKKPEILMDRIKERLSSYVVDEEFFNIAKKLLIASFIRTFDNISKISDLIVNSIIEYNEIYYNYFSIINNLNYDDFFKYKVDLNNYTFTILR